jgi:hypothetical protein
MFRHAESRSSKQRGFALMLVMFLMTLMLIAVMAAVPYVRTESQREKEQEMIWRGKQYVRGIKMFYRKNGRFPTSLDDLTKPKTGSLRFMRQRYKDPLNPTDGSWRLIYVGPGGQLIGSLKPPQTFQIPVAGGVAAGTSTPPQAGTGFGSSTFGQPNPQQANSQASNAGTSGQPAANASGAAATNAADASNATPSGLLSTDTPLMGGNIIGVGGKVNKRSVIVYDKAKNYRLFEFVWNPSKDLANALNANGVQTALPVQKGAAPAQSGFGQQPAQAPANPPADMPLPTPPPTPEQPPPQ